MFSKTKLPAEVKFQKKLHYISRGLRPQPTYAERKLWQCLRGRKFLGLRFLRQHPVDRYIVDFVCYERKLVLEVDGEIHTTQTERDKNRDSVLNHYGFQVLRFTNDEVIHNVDAVLDKIKTYT